MWSGFSIMCGLVVSWSDVPFGIVGMGGLIRVLSSSDPWSGFHGTFDAQQSLLVRFVIRWVCYYFGFREKCFGHFRFLNFVIFDIGEYPRLHFCT